MRPGHIGGPVGKQIKPYLRLRTHHSLTPNALEINNVCFETGEALNHFNLHLASFVKEIHQLSVHNFILFNKKVPHDTAGSRHYAINAT